MREFHELLRATSRTFAVGIEALPQPLRDAVTLGYLVLRVSDYYEDSPTLPPDRKHRALEGWADLVAEASPAPGGWGAAAESERRARLQELLEAIAPEDRTLPDHRAAVDAGHILQGLARLPPEMAHLLKKHTEATTRGMARWVLRGDDIPDEEALDDYMFEVAGRVGLLLTDLFLSVVELPPEREALLRKHAVSFGLGLQTVNVIRGLHEDPGRGWVYVPADLFPPGSGSADPRTLPEGDRRRILDFLVRKSGRHVADAFTYCRALPRSARGIRIFCIVPALIASRTAEAARENPGVFDAPPKIGRSAVRSLVLRTRLTWFSDRILERERNRALRLAELTEGGRPALS